MRNFIFAVLLFAAITTHAQTTPDTITTFYPTLARAADGADQSQVNYTGPDRTKYPVFYHRPTKAVFYVGRDKTRGFYRVSLDETARAAGF